MQPTRSATETLGPDPRPLVLLVDDELVSLEHAEDLLCSEGLRVNTARQGRQAVEAVAQHRYDLVLMDLLMPVMDGIAAAQAIRLQASPPPIVALSVQAGPEDRARSRAAGLVGHLAKPLQPTALRAVLDHWLPSRPRLPAPAAAPDERERAQRALQQLQGWPGLDLKRSLQQVGGAPDRLLRVLRRFGDTYRDGEPALLPAVAAGDLERVHRLCHALRGACSAVAAQGVIDRIAALEQALDPAQRGPAAAALDDTLRALALHVVAVLHPPTAAPTPPA